MEFKNREEMIEFEEKRINYYLESINAIDQGRIFTFYRLWLREIFIPKYRKLKKLYDSYSGGWYRDEEGYIHTKAIEFVNEEYLNNGEIIFIEDQDYNPYDLYCYCKDEFIEIGDVNIAYKFLKEKEEDING